MIKKGYYYCDCGKKIQIIDSKTIIIGKLFCRHCKKNHDVAIFNEKEYIPKIDK